MRRWFHWILPGLLLWVLIGSGCGKKSRDAEPEALTKIVLRTDWYAQVEHGGFYQALAEGYYEDAGLDVEIRQGGPASVDLKKVLNGEAHFAITRSADIIVDISRGAPVIMVGALMQHDPQVIMVHEESEIDSFEDLDGKTIMAVPGSGFLDIIRNTYGVDFSVVPMDYGMGHFLANKSAIQQAFLTNEPYFVAKHGANPRLLRISDSGFDPHRVWYTSKAFAHAHPDEVKAFTEASIRGWREFIAGNNRRALDLIAEKNPSMQEEFMAFSFRTLKEHRLVRGYPERGDQIGYIDRKRLEKLMDQLDAVGLLESELEVEDVYTPVFFQDVVDVPVEKMEE